MKRQRIQKAPYHAPQADIVRLRLSQPVVVADDFEVYGSHTPEGGGLTDGKENLWDDEGGDWEDEDNRWSVEWE